MSITHEMTSPPVRSAVPKHAGLRKKGQQLSTLPFDPNDLTRRLLPVLAEQRRHEAIDEKKRREQEAIKFKVADTERRRAQRAEKARSRKGPGASKKNETPQSTAPSKDLKKRRSLALIWRRSSHAPIESEPIPTYHHVPKQAAEQFKRNATPHKIQENEVPKLSLTAVRYHMLGDKALISDDPRLAPSERTKALKNAQSARELTLGRNQFQWSNKLGRSSTGDLGERRQSLRLDLQDIDESDDPSIPSPTIVSGKNRTDWTQGDELKKTKSRKSHLLGRVDSIWTLRVKSGAASRPDEKDATLSSGTETPKTPKSSFFWRLKR